PPVTALGGAYGLDVAAVGAVADDPGDDRREHPTDLLTDGRVKLRPTGHNGAGGGSGSVPVAVAGLGYAGAGSVLHRALAIRSRTPSNRQRTSVRPLRRPAGSSSDSAFRHPAR